MTKKGLGRGFDALFFDNSLNNNSGVTMLKLRDIEPNVDQARKVFDEDSLKELADSISVHGVLQPIIVKSLQNGFYRIIAGERRWRASKIAGLTEIPAIIKDVDELESSEISLVENLQRDDLNPVELAKGFRDLIETFGLTQEEVAAKTGKSRPTITNILRILNLPDKALSFLEANQITQGHAKALLTLNGTDFETKIVNIAETIISNDLSVRQTEIYIKRLLSFGKSKPHHSLVSLSYYKEVENKASSTLGRRVSIKQHQNGKGRLSLSFSSTDDLEKLLKELCGDIFVD